MNNTNIIEDANEWWSNLSPENRRSHLSKLGKVIVYDDELIKIYLSENPYESTSLFEQMAEVTKSASEMLTDLTTLRSVTRAIEHEEKQPDNLSLDVAAIKYADLDYGHFTDKTNAFKSGAKWHKEQSDKVITALKTLFDYPAEDLEGWANGADPIVMTFQPWHIKQALDAIKQSK